MESVVADILVPTLKNVLERAKGTFLDPGEKIILDRRLFERDAFEEGTADNADESLSTVVTSVEEEEPTDRASGDSVSKASGFIPLTRPSFDDGKEEAVDIEIKLFGEGKEKLDEF